MGICGACGHDPEPPGRLALTDPVGLADAPARQAVPLVAAQRAPRPAAGGPPGGAGGNVHPPAAVLRLGLGR